MSSIFFMAVQCCQCSTMQVKQRKKYSKSNKWSCVVCNQKQSILKVFAEAPMARDLRSFVQSFNMSRQSQTHPSSPEPPPPMAPDSPPVSKPRRSDWSEFLDPEHEIPVTTETGGGEFEPEITTEMPVGLFKKAKLNKYYNGGPSGIGDGGQELYKPVFSKRNASKQEKESLEPREVREAGDEKSRTCELKRGREASKWRDYLTRDDSDNAVRLVGGARSRGDDWSIDMLESLVNEEKVEDEEIHPDFL